MSRASDILELERIHAERERRAGKNKPLSFSPHKPTGKQKEFLSLTCLEALYGGAAGGGKSDALLMAALQFVHVKNYSAILFRRTYKDLALPGAIMDRAKEWLIPKGVHWNDTDKRFTFPSGATLSFGYLDSAQDRFRYQSAEFQFIGFDELTHFPEQWYRYLFSRLRRLTSSDVPLRVRSASNPGGIGHDWVRRRFVDKDEESDRTFVPATLKDNPFVDAESYLTSLAELDKSTRRQLLEGLWVRDAGGLVYQHTEDNLIAESPKLSHYLLGIDYGFTDDCGFTVCGWRDNDPTVYVVQSYRRSKMIPSDAALEAKSIENTYALSQIIGDIGGLGKGYAEEARARFHVPIQEAQKANKRGYISLLNGDLERGKIKVVRSTCQDLLKEWAELPWNEDHSKESPGFDNHCSDATLYAWRAACAYPERAIVKPPAHGTEEWRAAQEIRLEEAQLSRMARDSKLEWWETFE